MTVTKNPLWTQFLDTWYSKVHTNNIITYGWETIAGYVINLFTLRYYPAYMRSHQNDCFFNHKFRTMNLVGNFGKASRVESRVKIHIWDNI